MPSIQGCRRTLDGHLSGRGIVQGFHPLELGKGDMVTIFEPMSSLVQRGDQAVRVDAGHDASEWLFSGWVEHRELFSKVGKDGPEETKGVCNHQVHTVSMTIIGDGQLVPEWGAGEDDDLILL